MSEVPRYTGEAGTICLGLKNFHKNGTPHPSQFQILLKNWLLRDWLMGFRRAHYRGTSLIRNTPPYDPTVALCLGTYGDLRGVGVSYERGTPVAHTRCGHLHVRAGHIMHA